MKKTVGMILLLCLIMAALTGCEGGKGGEPVDEKLAQYVEFRAVTGYYEGKEYTAELPYLIGEGDNVLLKSENRNVEEFAERIRTSTRDQGYLAEVSCVLTEDTWVSIRLKGKGDTGSAADDHLWATNYNVTENSASCTPSQEFPNSENYEAWLHRYVETQYEKESGGKKRIYNFHVPYLYYVKDQGLTAAAAFTELADGGGIRDTFMEISVADGAKPYLTAAELEKIGELTFDFQGIAYPDIVSEWISDEYAIPLTWVNEDQFVYRFYSLDQMNPGFLDTFESLALKITFEPPGNPFNEDYTKVYTFTDDRGYKRFVLKTRYWGEKDWTAGMEQVSYAGTDWLLDAQAESFRGVAIGMSVNELFALYPHDLYLAGKAEPEKHPILNTKKPVKAYIYKDPEGYANQDLVFLVQNDAVISMDVASTYEYSRYDQKLGLSKPLTARNNKASDLEVNTLISYEKTFDVLEVLPDYPDPDQFTGEDRLIQVSLKVPQAASGVPGAALINKRIAESEPFVIGAAERLSRGDLSALAEGDLLGHLSMDYNVYRYKQAAALVIESAGYIFHGGGGRSFRIIYYDCDTGNVMTQREYLKKCGIPEESLLQKCAEENYVPSYLGWKALKSVYDVKFAVDESGKVMLYTDLGD